MIGQRVAHYEITAKIGEGGMGEVYQATDTKLKRNVALKVLPESVAQDPHRMGRFQREAQVLASLDHPNIGAIYGVEDAGDTKALVLQLIDGPTLEDRISQGPIPVDEALPIALQIADALEAAHEKGIIHRDLKPANIKITPEGQVKVLDFGLAKAMELPETDSDPGLTHSPTLTMAATQAGVILGTAAYMSPEQARGQVVDRRCDIWAFGCVIYEILSGSRAFSGETVSDTLAAILKETPDFEKLPDSVPGWVRRLLRRCLAKDPKRRLRDAGDVRLELAEALAGIENNDPDGATQAEPVAVGGVSGRSIALVTAAAVLITVALTLIGVSWFGTPDTRPGGVLRSEILPAAGERLSPWLSVPVISPDGRTIAYTVRKGASSRIYLRHLDEFQATSLAGTERGGLPFFSPDGTWLGFTVRGEAMYKVPVAGGERTLVASGAWWDTRASWGPGDKIVADSLGNIKDGQGGLALVDVGTRAVTTITRRNSDAGEAYHRYPKMLPDGSVLFSIDEVGNRSVLARYFPDNDSRETLDVEGSGPFSYLSSGHLVFQQAGVSVVAPFDLTDSTLGTPVPVMPGVDPLFLDVSPGGTAVYLHFPGGGGSSIVRVGRDGSATRLIEQKANYRWPRLSPDGLRLAIGKEEGEATNWFAGKQAPSIWTIDLASSRESLLQDSGGYNTEPVWTPNGKRIAYSAARTTSDIYWQEARGGVSEPLSEEDLDQWPTSFSADGSVLMFYGSPLPGRTAIMGSASTDQDDIWVVPVDGSSPAKAIVREPGSQKSGRFHPQGSWIAYSSMETGKPQIMVRKYPELEPRFTASSDGGVDPSWSPDGKELFYLKDDRMMAVAFNPDSADPLGAETELFQFDFAFDPSGDQSYDVFPDGQHFVMLQQDAQNPPRLRVVAGFSDEVSRLLSLQD
ncbi:MAG: protein kinase [Acidobacteriota bacterium]|nr:MAG: protein kinase [Acidobacteriota bacterium]